MHSPLGEGPTYTTLSGQVGGGGSNKKCGQKNTQKMQFIYISGPNVLNFEFGFFYLFII